MIKKITRLVGDFCRGYSVQRVGTEERVLTERYFAEEERGRQAGSPYAGFYNVQVGIDTLNRIQRQLQKLRNTKAEILGRRAYNMLHPSLAKECRESRW